MQESQQPGDDLTQRIYRMFLPELREMQSNGLLRLPQIPLEPYGSHLRYHLAAAAVYGVAKRAKLKITPIASNSPEEFALRKSLRGRFLESEIADIGEMPIDEVFDELETHGYSREDVKASGEKISEMAQFYGSLQDDESEEEVSVPESKASPSSHKVTRIDALFKIEGHEESNVATYCRAHTAQGHSDSVFFWDTDEFEADQPYDQMDYTVELEQVIDSDTYQVFLSTVVGDILSLQDKDEEDDIEGMVARLEFELDTRD